MLIAGLFAASLYAIEPADEAVPIVYDTPRKLAVLADDEIDESSGLARSLSRPGAFWTHNDSGDSPRLFLIDEAGQTLGCFKVDGAKSIDWEDMCSFSQGEKNYLMIGDVGDNGRRRKQVELYLLEEPDVSRHEAGENGRIPVRMTIAVTYEGGAHDCEAIAVDPAAGNIYLLAKQFSTACALFEVALPREQPPAPLEAKRIGALSAPWATAMDVSPDGNRMIVLTYGDAYEFTRGRDDWSVALKRPARKIQMPARRQGEAICYARDGRSLYLTSEGRGQPLWLVKERKLP